MICAQASSTSGIRVYLPNPIRIEDFAWASPSPIARSTWLGRPEPLAQAEPAENATLAKLGQQPGDIDAIAAQVEVAVPARAGRAVERPVTEQFAGAAPEPRDVRRIGIGAFPRQLCRRAETGAQRGA